MKEEEVKKIVKDAIKEMIRSGVIEDDFSGAAYAEIKAKLYKYYDDFEEDEKITAAIDAIADDKYSSVIPLFFGHRRTNEKIAEMLNVDVTTVTKNKKRLCLEIYKSIQ